MSYHDKMRALMRSPTAMAKFQMTGRLPQGVVPTSPLIDLLERLGPGRLVRITGLRVGAALGYEGSRQFQTAAQAMRWLKPAQEVFGTFPAESWRNKRFQGPIYLEDLLECAASYPQSILAECRHLCRPGQASKRGPSPDSSQHDAPDEAGESPSLPKLRP